MSDETNTGNGGDDGGDEKQSRMSDLQERYGSSSRSRSSSIRQGLAERKASGQPSDLVAVSLMLPMNVAPGTAHRKVYYGFEGSDDNSVVLPRTQNRVEILCPRGGSVSGYSVDVDGTGHESNSQEFNYEHEEPEEGSAEALRQQEPGGIKVTSARAVTSEEAIGLLDRALPAGHTGEEGDDDNPLGGDGTVEGTKVGPKTLIPPNPNTDVGIGTNIGSPAGTGTASLMEPTALRMPSL